MAKRIVLTTFGSFGDLHPYMALALELRRRGHEAVIATSGVYRKKIEGAGLGFADVRPDLLPPEEAQDMIAKVMDERRGPAYLFKKMLMPALRDSYDDLLAATDGADLMIGHLITFAAPLVAEKRRLRWVSIALQPSVFFSVYDPPILPGAPWPAWFHGLGPGVTRALFSLARGVQSFWFQPILGLRKELGLPPPACADLDMQVSPYLHLALFSRMLAAPQPDWPAQTRQTGFCFYDQLEAGKDLTAEIDAFLNAGSPPVVFTLGSSAVMNPGTFYKESLEAVKPLNTRALLLVGSDPGGLLSQKLPDSILAAPYAPYSEVFPRCAAIVHQGGVGTTAQALRSGRPQLVVPFAYDQPDNGARVARQGAGSVLARRRYKSERVVEALKTLLENPSFARRAGEIGQIVREEEGVWAAADAVDEQLALAGVE
ncbi:MAG TPA: glycosyltransferase [Capsulimonadaceae bacterium]|nr:glycosyltransferase [Capsulimonadaceae bacterium]